MGTLADFLRNLPDTDNPLGDQPGEAVERTRGMKRDALVSFLRGAPEAAATLTTGITGQVLGGLHGLASGTRAGLSALAQDGDAGAAVDTGVARGVADSERTTQRFTYPSASPEAKQVLGHVGKLIEPYSEAWRRSVADPLGEVAPVLGAAAAAVPAILPGPKGAVGAVEAGVKTAGKAAKAAERVVGAGEAAAAPAAASSAATRLEAAIARPDTGVPDAVQAALRVMRIADDSGIHVGDRNVAFNRALQAARDRLREGGTFADAEAAAHHVTFSRPEAATAYSTPPAGGTGHPLTQPIASSVVERAMQGVSSSQYDVLREQVMRGVTEAIAAGGSFDQALAVGRGIAQRPVALNERTFSQQAAIEAQHAANARPSGHDLLAARIARDREARGGQPLPGSTTDLQQQRTAALREEGGESPGALLASHLRAVGEARRINEAQPSPDNLWRLQQAEARLQRHREQRDALPSGDLQTRAVMGAQAYMGQLEREGRLSAGLRRVFESRIEQMHRGELEDSHLQSYADFAPGGSRYQQAPPGAGIETATAFADEPPMSMSRADALRDVQERRNELPLDDWTPEPPMTRPAGSMSIEELRAQQQQQPSWWTPHLEQRLSEVDPGEWLGARRNESHGGGVGPEALEARSRILARRLVGDESPEFGSAMQYIRRRLEGDAPATPHPLREPTPPTGFTIEQVRAQQMAIEAVDRWNTTHNANATVGSQQINAVYARALDRATAALREGASMEDARNAAHSAVSQMAPGGDLLGHPAPREPLRLAGMDYSALDAEPAAAAGGADAPPWHEHPDLQQLRQQKGLPGISNVDPSWEHQQLIPGLEPLTPQAGARNAAMRLGLRRPNLQRELRRGDPAMNRDAVNAFLEGGRDNPDMFQYGVDPMRTGEVQAGASLEDYADAYNRRFPKADVEIHRGGYEDFEPSDWDHIDVDPEPLYHGHGEVMRDRYGDVIEDKKTHDRGDYPVYDEEGNVKYLEGVTSHFGEPKKYTALGHELRRTPADRWGGGGEPKYEPRLSEGGERMRDEQGDLKTDATHDEEAYYQRLDDAREEAWRESQGNRGNSGDTQLTAAGGGDMTIYGSRHMDAQPNKGPYGSLLYQLLFNEASHGGGRIGGGGLSHVNQLRILSNANSNYARTGVNPRSLQGTASGTLPHDPNSGMAHDRFAEGPEIWRSESDEALKRAIEGGSSYAGGGRPERMAFDPDVGFTLDGKPATQADLKGAFSSMSPGVKNRWGEPGSGVGIKTLMRSAVFDWVRDATPQEAAHVAKNWSKKYGPLFGVAGVGLSLQEALREKADEGVQ